MVFNGIDHSNPYIHSTTVLCDTMAPYLVHVMYMYCIHMHMYVCVSMTLLKLLVLCDMLTFRLLLSSAH